MEPSIVILNGSLGGSGGNTQAVLTQLIAELEPRSRVEVVHLATDRRQAADLEPLLEAASGFVFASGTYWDSWGSPLQRFFEDATPFEGGPMWLGKPAAVVVTMHSVGGKGVLSRMQGVLSTLGLTIPPMTGFAYSYACHLALAGETWNPAFADFWQLGDLETIAHNLLESIAGGAQLATLGCRTREPWTPLDSCRLVGGTAMISLGVQIIADLYDCDRERLDDAKLVCEVMLEAARRARATIITHNFHRFSPQGVSGVVIIAESHLAIHTWPENNYAAVDLFTCGDIAHAEECFAYLKDMFKSGRSTTTTIQRGQHALRTMPNT